MIPPDFEVKVVNSIDAVGETAWNDLSMNQPFQSYRWYAFGEKVMTETGCRPTYIILGLDGKPVARGTFWLVPNEPLPIHGITKTILESILRSRPLFTCRSPLSGLSGLILPDPPLQKSALQTISRVAAEQAHMQHASFIVFDYMSREFYKDNDWPESAVGTIVGDPGTQMKIRWPDFDGYLQDLSTKSRKNYRRYDREAEECHLTIHRSFEPARLDEAGPLLQNVYNRYHESPNPWSMLMLKYFPMVGGTLLTVEAEGKLVGCELILGDCGSKFTTALGLDYNIKDLYFLLNYADIQCAIEDGTKILHWGSGAYDVKNKLGFELEYNNFAVFLGIGKTFDYLGRLAARWVD